MKANFIQFINNNKKFISFYLIWFLIHLTFLLVNWNDGYTSDFWPFEKNSELDDYDLTEFLYYMIVPLVIFAFWKLRGNDIK